MESCGSQTAYPVQAERAGIASRGTKLTLALDGRYVDPVHALTRSHGSSPPIMHETASGIGARFIIACRDSPQSLLVFARRFHLRTSLEAGITRLQRYAAAQGDPDPARPWPHGSTVGAAPCHRQRLSRVASDSPLLAAGLDDARRERHRPLASAADSAPVAGSPNDQAGRLPHFRASRRAQRHNLAASMRRLTAHEPAPVHRSVQAMSLPPPSAPLVPAGATVAVPGFAAEDGALRGALSI